MAESSTTSSLTSTSHTLTIAPGPMSGRAGNGAGGGGHASAAGTLPSLSDISAALAFREALRAPKRHAFLQPTAALPTASSQFAQVALSAFAGQVSDEQQERLRQHHALTAARKKRRRSGSGAAGPGADADAAEAAKDAAAIAPVGPLLKIRRVHVDGFELPQIWQQSNRILAASLLQAKHTLAQLDKEDASSDDEDDKANGLSAGEEEDDVDESDLEGLSGLEEEEDDDDDDNEDEDEDDEEEEEADEEEVDDDEDDIRQPSRTLVEDANGLNDGFFDIDEFNKQAQYFEDQDARADPNTDRVSDEDEELDWHTDPFAVPVARKTKKASTSQAKKGKGREVRRPKGGRAEQDSDDEVVEEDEEDDGPPIFGDMDLNAPFGASDDENDDDDDNDVEGGLARGLDMDLSASDIFYKDFFAPPAGRKPPRSDRDRPGRPRAADTAAAAAAAEAEKVNGGGAYQPDETEIRRGMASVRRDLFEQVSDDGLVADEDGDEEADDDSAGHVAGLSDVEDAGDPRARRSTHARRQAKILAEIRRLEAEAVRAKDWTMAGEAAAAARPLNSLLEEDLDFEHIGKPVPVATQELTEDIEAMVKRRILEQSFDEVRRRYAVTDDADGGRGDRRGLVEVDDQQAKQGLASVYEEAHQKQAATLAGDTPYVSATDARQAAEEREVARLWREVSAQLDALSSWHYKPRPAAPLLTVVADVATVAMEDAQPATAQGLAAGAGGGAGRMLAPQEVYRPGSKTATGGGGDGNRAADGGDDDGILVVPKSGLPVARDELTREDRKRRRRRNKERIRKSGSGFKAAAGGAGADAAGAGSSGSGGGRAARDNDTMATLRKAGVKVIGRKGEIRDLDGGIPQAAQAVSSGHYKL